MKFSTVAAAFATLIITSPASAVDSSQGNSVAAKPAKERTYCLQFGLDTGSRINRVECKTKREWAQLGVDIDDLGK